MPRLPAILGRLFAALIAAAVIYRCIRLHDRVGTWELAAIRAFPLIVLGLLAAIGSLLAGSAWPVRTGNTECCASCGHTWVPDDHILINHCQECGAAWRWFDGRATGQLRSRPLLLALGLILIAATPAAIIADGVGAISLRSARPRWMLLKSLQSSPSAEAFSDFLALRPTAQADPALREEIASAIIQRYTANIEVPSEFIGWMNRAAAAGSLSPATIDRWLDESLELRLDVPAIAQINQSIPTTITARFRGDWSLAADVPLLVLGGFTIEPDDFKPPSPAYTINCSTIPSWQNISTASLQAPSAPTTMTVTYRAWLILGDPRSSVQFDTLGSPIAPGASLARPLTWTRTIEIIDDATPPKPSSP